MADIIDNEELVIQDIKRVYPNLNEHFIKLALSYAEHHTDEEIEALLNNPDNQATTRDPPDEQATFDICSE